MGEDKTPIFNPSFDNLSLKKIIFGDVSFYILCVHGSEKVEMQQTSMGLKETEK